MKFDKETFIHEVYPNRLASIYAVKVPEAIAPPVYKALEAHALAI